MRGSCGRREEAKKIETGGTLYLSLTRGCTVAGGGIRKIYGKIGLFPPIYTYPHN